MIAQLSSGVGSPGADINQYSDDILLTFFTSLEMIHMCTKVNSVNRTLQGLLMFVGVVSRPSHDTVATNITWQ